jgi:hypothetical protein
MDRRIIAVSIVLIITTGFVGPGYLKAKRTLIFEDDFEYYPIDSFPSSGGWILKFDGKGAEYQKIVYLESENKWLQLWGSHGKNWCATAMKNFSWSSNILSYEVFVRTESTSLKSETVAYVGFYNEDKGESGTGIARVFFCGDGTIRLDHIRHDNEHESEILQKYSPNLLYRINVTLNVNSKEYSIWIDGKLRKKGAHESNPNDVKSFYLVSEHAGVKAYFDDVTVLEGYSYDHDKDNDGIIDDCDDCDNPGCKDVNPSGCPIDSDNDGVRDCDDKCPEEHGEREDGCPEIDFDEDGVLDEKDSCYNPGCTIVDAQGCPIDSDNDGVRDCDDKCPEEHGEREDGCPSNTEKQLIITILVLIICGVLSTLLGRWGKIRIATIPLAIIAFCIFYLVKLLIYQWYGSPKESVLVGIISAAPLILLLIQWWWKYLKEIRKNNIQE